MHKPRYSFAVIFVVAKIGIYGGSFNPVHFGHTGLVKWVKEHTDLDEIWMMVSPNNPLKDSSTLVDEQVRLKDVEEAIRNIPGVKASDYEFTLPRPSYTAHTLRELQQTNPEHEFTLIIGEDNWEIFERWREWKYILENFRIIVYPRHGSITKNQNTLVNTDTANVLFMDGAPYFDISSTELRKQQSQNKR